MNAQERAAHEETILWLQTLGFVGFGIALLIVLCTLAIVLAIKGVI